MIENPYWRWSRLWLVGLLLAAAGIPGAAQTEPLAGVDDRWDHFTSPNFELYSRRSEPESRAVLRSLELLRAVFIEQLHLIERARLDVTIYYFRTVADFQAYCWGHVKKNTSYRGFYYHHLDRAVIALAPTETSDESRRLILHEYVHHLFRACEQDPLLWMNEGMAELFGSLRENRKNIEYGHPHPAWIMALNAGKLLPLETIFGADHTSSLHHSTRSTELLYAQSWALLHYWQFGKSGLPREAINRFLGVAVDRRLAAGVDLRAYFNECFGMDYPEMLARLERYVRYGEYTFGWQAAPAIASSSSYLRRSVGRDEIRLRLADLALRTTDSGAAKLILLEATEKFPDDPRPFEILDTQALRERDEISARKWWERAIDAGSRNVAVYRELGLMESKAWFADFNYDFRLPEETAQRLRGRLRSSIAQEPMQTEAYEMLAWVEAFSGEPFLANINLVQKGFGQLKRKDRTLLALAMVRIRMGKTDDGLQLIDQLETVAPDAWTTNAAAVIRRRLSNQPARQPGPPPRPSRNAPAGPTVIREVELKLPTIDLPPRGAAP